MNQLPTTPQPSRSLNRLIIGYMLVSGGIFATLILMWIVSSIKGSHPYQATLEAVRAHPEAVAALGEPIDPAFVTTGSYSSGEGSAHANLSIPVKGPKGRARAYVSGVLEKGADEWVYFDWRLVLPGREEPILLGPTLSYVEWVEREIAREKEEKAKAEVLSGGVLEKSEGGVKFEIDSDE